MGTPRATPPLPHTRSIMWIRTPVHGHAACLQSTEATPIARQQIKRRCDDALQRGGGGGERARAATVVVVSTAVLMLSCARVLPSAVATHVVGSSIGHGSSCAGAAADAPRLLQRRRRLSCRNEGGEASAKSRIPSSCSVATIPRGGASGKNRASSAPDAAIHIPTAAVDGEHDGDGGNKGGDADTVVEDVSGEEENGDVDETEEREAVSDDGEAGDGGDEDSEEDEMLREDEGEEEEAAGGGDGSEASPDGASTTQTTRRPTAPLFSFPPGPRIDRTKAEESLQEILPLQQRLVKYLTEDKIFGAQILCSLYFLASAVAFSVDGKKYRGSYHAALATLMIKQWGTVIGRVQRVLVPHLLYEPKRYAKYRARVSAMALDPAVQGLIYCFIFLFMPLGKALIPLMVKEAVYLLWVAKEVLQIASPALVDTLTSLLESPLSVFMTAGDVGKWREMAETEKRLLLGRRLAQVCFKLEMLMPFSMALQILPGVVQATIVRANMGEGEETAAGRSGGCGMLAQFSRALPLGNFVLMMLAYVKLLTVRNGQLEDDIRIMRGLKIRGYNCEWVEQLVDSIVFGKMVGCPWWVGVLASLFSLLPNHEGTKAIMASDNKLKTATMMLLNLAIGRTPGGVEDDEDEEAEEESAGGEGDEKLPQTKLSKIAKVAAVATGITDS